MPIPQKASAFDYSRLDGETSQLIQQQTGEIRMLMRRTAQGIIEVGCKLIEIKALLGHGNFENWLKAEFDWGLWTARKFMQVAEQFKSVNFTDLSIAPSALYVLAASSTPETVRKEALKRADAGESITYTAALALKKKYSPPPESPPPVEKQPSAADRPSPKTVPQPSPPSLTTEPRRPSPEILAIRPNRAKQSPSTPSKETETPPPSPTPSFEVEPGFWWQLGKKHFLYCGAPNSARFKERLPQEIALTLSFPLTPDWHLDLPTSAHSEVVLFSRYRDLDETLLREAIERLLLLYTEGEDTVVFSFLPDPEFLLLADKLGCRCFIAEPDVRRCEQAIATWNQTGDRAEKMRGLRF